MSCKLRPTQIIKMVATVFSFQSHEMLGGFLVTVEMNSRDDNQQALVVVNVFNDLVSKNPWWKRKLSKVGRRCETEYPEAHFSWEQAKQTKGTSWIHELRLLVFVCWYRFCLGSSMLTGFAFLYTFHVVAHGYWHDVIFQKKPGRRIKSPFKTSALTW